MTRREEVQKVTATSASVTTSGETTADAVVQATGMAADPISWALAREILTSEAMLRFKVLSALLETGVDPDRLTLEYPHPTMEMASVDAVILNAKLAPETAIEFKYHRKYDNSDFVYAMPAGQLFNDFAKLRDFTGVNKRYVVYLTDGMMLRHVEKRENGLSALLDSRREHTILNDDIRAKKAKGFWKYAGNWSRSARLRMPKRWDLRSGHTLIVWQIREVDDSPH